MVVSLLHELHLKITGILDDDISKFGLNIHDIPVIGNIETLAGDPNAKAIIAIGDNRTRKRIVYRFKRINWMSLIHPCAYVDSSVFIGKGTIIMAGAVIQPDSMIGNHVIINTGATIDHDCIINDYSHIAPGCHLAGNVTIGEGVLTGIGSSFIQGINIGKWSVVGAGSVVVKEVDKYCMAKGVPARFDRYLNIQDQE